MQWAYVSFLGADRYGVIGTPIKTTQLFWLEAISGDHAIEPGDCFCLSVGDQSEILIHDPLIQGRLVSHKWYELG